MLFRFRRAPLLVALIVLMLMILPGSVEAQQSGPQYLLFKIFSGTADPHTGVFQRGMSKPGLLTIVRRISETLQPAPGNPNRILGFSVGPIAMDQGEDGARQLIRDAFDTASQTNMAMALHLDDYMFWSQASNPDGQLLRSIQGTTEWKDWAGTPSAGLQIGWLPNVNLPPQMCYESPQVIDFVVHWTRDVIGQEIKTQYDKLIQAGKGQLFAGVIAGWESNFSDGYCSLSHLGYSAKNPPSDFDHERERVLQRHIQLWAKSIYDAGIPPSKIFTHIAPMPRDDYARLIAASPRDRIRKMPQSTALNAYWTAFNSSSSPGFSAYVDPNRFDDISSALQTNNATAWAMAEGTNLVLEPGGPAQSSLSWEGYLARSFNHGARIVNIFGGFQGPQLGTFQRAAESAEALSAYRKFLRGDSLME